MIVLVGSQKGGAGKTTVAINLAAEWARQFKDVVLVDADSQRSAARWHADRETNGHLPAIACVEKQGNVKDTLTDLDQRYDIVVVDVAGKDSKEMRTAMTAADVLLVTVRPSQLDLDTLDHMSEVISAAQDFNERLQAYGVLTQVPTNTQVTERADAIEYLGDFPLIRPLKGLIHERKAYRDVVGEGLGVVEWTNPLAKAEIQQLAVEVLS